MPVFARVARASVLAEAREDYILAARSFGARTRDLLFGNLLPNIQAPLIVQAAFAAGDGDCRRGGGVVPGARRPAAGCQLGHHAGRGPPLRAFRAPGGWCCSRRSAIAMAVLSFNLLGDALRDALDPTLWSAAEPTSSRSTSSRSRTDGSRCTSEAHPARRAPPERPRSRPPGALVRAVDDISFTVQAGRGRRAWSARAAPARARCCARCSADQAARAGRRGRGLFDGRDLRSLAGRRDALRSAAARSA